MVQKAISYVRALWDLPSNGPAQQASHPWMKAGSHVRPGSGKASTKRGGAGCFQLLHPKWKQESNLAATIELCLLLLLHLYAAPTSSCRPSPVHSMMANQQGGG
jgi:hypothetical protein